MWQLKLYVHVGFHSNRADIKLQWVEKDTCNSHIGYTKEDYSLIFAANQL